MKNAEEFLKGCEHDGSYIPVSEVLRLMEQYASIREKEAISLLIETLRRISQYDSVEDLRDNSGDNYGLDDWHEALEYAYENVIEDAKIGLQKYSEYTKHKEQ